jgi:hypothetical protein
MAEEYAVVWRVSDGPRFVGRLGVDDAGLHLRGTSTDGELADRILGPDDIVGVRVLRPGRDEADGSHSVVIRQRDGGLLSVVALNGAGRLFEIANLAAEMAGRAPRTSIRVAVEVPIRRGHRDRVCDLVRQGPPFDPATIAGLQSHDVYISGNSVIFIFEGANVRDIVEKLMHTTSVWMAATEWRQSITGRPRVLEDGYAWRRRDSQAGSGVGR